MNMCQSRKSDSLTPGWFSKIRVGLSDYLRAKGLTSALRALIEGSLIVQRPTTYPNRLALPPRRICFGCVWCGVMISHVEDVD